VFRRGTGTELPELPSWLRGPGGPDEPIAAELRQMLARITGRDELAGLPADAPLFGAGVSLDSLTGTLLLREVQRRFGVDVAGTDLNLDALATLGTLASFIAGQGGS
jgi:acyl carrier protein